MGPAIIPLLLVQEGERDDYSPADVEHTSQQTARSIHVSTARPMGSFNSPPSQKCSVRSKPASASSMACRSCCRPPLLPGPAAAASAAFLDGGCQVHAEMSSGASRPTAVSNQESVAWQTASLEASPASRAAERRRRGAQRRSSAARAVMSWRPGSVDPEAGRALHGAHSAKA